MTEVAKLIADMVRAGVDPELIGRAAAALAEREPVRVIDEQAERRRAADRERKRLRNSAETADLVEVVSPKKETSPTPPKEKTTPSQSVAIATSPKRAARLQGDWSLPVEWRQEAIAVGLPADRVDAEACKMRDWSLSSPKGAKLDWRATWRNWARQAAENTPKSRGSPPRQPPNGSHHFNNLAEEMTDEPERTFGSDQGNWDDARGVPVLTISDFRRHG